MAKLVQVWIEDEVWGRLSAAAATLGQSRPAFIRALFEESKDIERLLDERKKQIAEGTVFWRERALIAEETVKQDVAPLSWSACAICRGRQ